MRPGIDRRSLLAASAAALGLPLLSGASTAAQRKLIVIYAQGGWDVTFAVDPKQGVPGFDGPSPDSGQFESVEVIGGIPLQVNSRKRPNVAALFEAHADRICVLNGVWVGAVTHWTAQGRVLTGTLDEYAPDIATVTGVARDDGAPLASVDFSSIGRFGPYAARTARFGRTGQIAGVVDPTLRLDDLQQPSYRGFRLDDGDRQALRAFLEAENAVDPIGARPNGATMLADRAEALRRAQLVQGLTVPEAERYTLEAQLEAAVDLLEAGVCHGATVETGASWDTHLDEPAQHGLWNDLCAALHRMLDVLVQRGLDQQITVAVVSEMARTPRRNSSNGCDHWPHTSAMLFGAGVRGGQVIGATDDAFHSVPIDLETGDRTAKGVVPRPENLLAGVLETLDIDPGDWLPGVPALRGFQG